MSSKEAQILREERAASPVDGGALTHYLAQLYRFDLAAKKRIADAIRNDPDFASLPNPHNLSKKDRFFCCDTAIHYILVKFWTDSAAHIIKR